MIELITKGINKIFGAKADKDLKMIKPIVDQINQEYAKLKTITDDQLRNKTYEIKSVISEGLKSIDQKIEDTRQKAQTTTNIAEKDQLFSTLDDYEKERNEKLEVILNQVLPLGFAVVRETARRLAENKQLKVTASDWDREIAAKKDNVSIEFEHAIWSNKWIAAGNEMEWAMVHYDVQLIGGIVLHQGKISEMATGEGKTLVATLPAYLNALAGRGVHVITVNDYLAKRDAQWMAPLFEFHGLSVDCIDNYRPHSPERIAAYKCDITYGTNNEFGFDYLRDNMAHDMDELVQRRHHFAMIDEVDSVLIDEARTPLIISGPIPKGDVHEFEQLKPFVVKLYEAQKKLVNNFLIEGKKKFKAGLKDEAGNALFRAHRGLPKSKPLIKFLSEGGVKQVMQKTENYYLQENSKHMPEADKPLFFTIDEKTNSVDLTDKGHELIASGSNDPDFFILPDLSKLLAEVENNQSLTKEEKVSKKEEILDAYSIKAERIHTISQLLKAYTMFEKDVDYIIADGKVMIVDEQTGRALDGRRYSDGLHQALEAKEGMKIEDQTQTYATITLQNYFRMYHKLGGMTGTAETESTEFWEIYGLDVIVIPTNRPILRKDQQDKVYKTVREKFNAVALEIEEMTKQGRPVLVGTTSVENSELLSRMLQRLKVAHEVLNAKQHAREADIVAEAGKPRAVTIATNMAGRGTDIKLTPESKAAGGLAIIGTERHDSRRVDRQLRGRAGRQGDPGSSQFFVSLEDRLMRLFGSDRIAKVMDRFGYKEGEVIQHSMITKSIERAQKKVEENNFGIRKRLLEYDNIMNSQREVIYKLRRNALSGERLKVDIQNMFYNISRGLVDNSKMPGGQLEDLQLDTISSFGIEANVTQEELNKAGNNHELAIRIMKQAMTHYNERNNIIKEQSFPIIKHNFEQRGATVENILVPFTDDKIGMNVKVGLKEAFETECGALINKLEQGATLALIDQGWKEHLRDMDDLKQQVQNMSIAQKDPIVTYKQESFDLFKIFITEVNSEIISFLAKSHLNVPSEDELQAAREQQMKRRQEVAQKENFEEERRRQSLEHQKAQQQAAAEQQEQVEVTKPLEKKVLPGRNDKVSVKYSDGTVKKGVKFKTVVADLEANRCVLLED